MKATNLNMSGIEQCKKDGYSTPVCYMANFTGELTKNAAIAAGMLIGVKNPITGGALIFEAGHLGEITTEQIKNYFGKITQPQEQTHTYKNQVPPIEVILDFDYVRLDHNFRKLLKIELEPLNENMKMYNTQLTENTNKDYIKLLNERAKLADEMKLQVDKDKMVNSTIAVIDAMTAISPPELAKMLAITSSAISIGSGFAGVGALASIHPVGLGVMALCLVISVSGLLDDNDGIDPNYIYFTHIMDAIKKIQQQLHTIQIQLNSRFDTLEKQLERVSKTLNYAIYNVKSQIDYLIHDQHRQSIMINFKLNAISNQINSMELILGNGIKEIQWRPIYEMISDYQQYNTRFGVTMERRDLLKILTTIESAIINPPMLDFSNGHYLLQKSFTIEVDNKVVNFWSNLGFLTGKSLPNIDMLCDLLDNYIQIRMELVNQGTVYDPNMIIRTKIINYVRQFATITFDAEYIQSIVQNIIETNKQIKMITETINTQQSEILIHMRLDDELMEPFYRERKDGLHLAGVDYHDCRGADSSGNYGVSQWIINDRELLEPEFRRNFTLVGRKIIIKGMPGATGFNKVDSTGCYDLPIICRNRSIFACIDSQLSTYIQAEKEGYGELQYHYFVNCNEQPLDLQKVEIEMFDGFSTGCYSVEKIGSRTVSKNIVCGQHLYFTFTIKCLWYSNQMHKTSELGVFTSNQTKSTQTIDRNFMATLYRTDITTDQAKYTHPYIITKYVNEEQLINSSVFQFTPNSSLTVITDLYANKISSTKSVNNEKIMIATQEHYNVIRRSLKQLQLICSSTNSFPQLLKLISNNYIGLVDVSSKAQYDNCINRLSYFTGSIQTHVHSRLIQLIEFLSL